MTESIDLNIRVADRFFTRLRGLLFAPPLPAGTGLLITRCNSVHTFFMHYSIDVIFLDNKNTILKIANHVRPWRATACRKAAATLELYAGEAARLQLEPGMSLASIMEN